MDAESSKPVVEVSVRGRLLAAAIALFNRKGYAPTTVREIVDAAGVTKPALYYYFGSKEGIYLAILQESLAYFEIELQVAMETEGTIRERLQRLAAKVYALFREHSEVVRLVHAVYYGPPQGAPTFNFHRFHELLVDAIKRLVERGIATGELSAGSVEDTTLALLGATNVCMELELAHPEMQVGEPGLRRVLDVVFDGASPVVSRIGE